LDPSELNLSAYQKAVNQLSTMVIDPQLLMPSNSDFNHYELVMKSQIARAMNQYLETPSHWDGAFPLDPSTIEKISCDKPTIVMLKLMEESDNSAEGIGQVLEAIWRQTGLEPDQFSLDYSQWMRTLVHVRISIPYETYNTLATIQRTILTISYSSWVHLIPYGILLRPFSLHILVIHQMKKISVLGAVYLLWGYPWRK
jgi:hypothetical protein